MDNVGAMYTTGTSVADTGRTTERESDPLALTPSQIRALGVAWLRRRPAGITNRTTAAADVEETVRWFADAPVTIPTAR